MKSLAYDGLDLKAHLPYTWLGQADMGRVRMLKHDNGAVTDITTGHAGNEILGHTLDNCTFTLVAPLDVFDKAGPIVALNRPTGAFESAGELYISTFNALTLNATDVSSNSFALAGVATTYYLVDVEPTPACLGTARSTAAPGGTCANPVYAGDFTLPEGRHSVYYVGVDKLGNVGGIGVSSVAVDGTAPEAWLAINGAPLAPGATVEVMAGDLLTLSATDYASGGLASGLATTYFLVDITPEECEYSDWSGGVNGPGSPGSCENKFYAGPVSLPIGEHDVYFSAVDSVGNRSGIKNVRVVVAAKASYENPANWPYYEFLYKFGETGTLPGQFHNPRDTDFDSQGNLLVLDRNNSRVQRLNPEGVPIATWGSFGREAGQMWDPWQITACPDGSVWMLDSGNYRLQKFSAGGKYLLEIPYLISGMSLPQYNYSAFWKIACDKNSFIHAVGIDYFFKFSPDGVLVSSVSNQGHHGSHISSFAIDKNNTYYIGGWEGVPPYKVFLQEISSTGVRIANIDAGEAARDLAVDAHGNVYAAYVGSVGIYSGRLENLANFGRMPKYSEYGEYGLDTIVSIAVSPNSGRVFVVSGSTVSVYGLDHRAPRQPEIYLPKDGQVTLSTAVVLSGMAESGARVKAFLGASLAGEASADQAGRFALKAELPLGRQTLNVSAVDAAGNYSLPKLLTLNIEKMTAVQFSTPIYGPSNFQVYDTTAVVCGDFDKDGKPDVVGFSEDGVYAFYKGNGGGTFSFIYAGEVLPMPRYGRGGHGDNAVAIDINKDGNLDIAVSMHDASLYPVQSNFLMVMLGNGDGAFRTPQKIDSIETFAGITSGDFDRDGFLDLATVSSKQIKIYFGDQAGLFFLRNGASFPSGIDSGAERYYANEGGIKAADLDNDGALDLVFRNAVLFGDGVGGFPRPLILPFQSYDVFAGGVKDVEIIDTDRDGYKDIVLVSPNKVASYLNKGGKEFVLAQEILSAYSNPNFFVPEAAVSDDFNGDGIPDLAISPMTICNLYLLMGNGDGTFSGPIRYPTNNTRFYQGDVGTIDSADFNGDGRKDVVMAASSADFADGSKLNTFFSFLNNTAIPDRIPPAPAAISVSSVSGGINVSWTAPGDDNMSGQAASYDLRYAQFPINSEALLAGAVKVENLPAPRPAGQAETVNVPNLPGGATWYFALKTFDEAGNASALSNSPGVFVEFIYVSSRSAGGNPEVIINADKHLSTLFVGTDSLKGVSAISVASAQGLMFASGIYEIGPDGKYDPPIMLTFYYSTATVAAAGLLEEDVFVYEHFSVGGWRQLPGQVRDVVNHKITVPITQIASLFGIFGEVRDRTAPVTAFSVSGASWTAGGLVYLSTGAVVDLTASDPVVYGTSSGVAFTGFRVDAGSAAPFAAYAGPFTPEAGPRLLEFFSRDNAGNEEALKSVSLFVDSAAPASVITAAGQNGSNGWYLSALEVSIKASDAASGVAGVRYAADGGEYQAYVSSLAIVAEGTHSVAAYAADNVGNAGEPVLAAFKLDLSTPIVSYSLSPAPGPSGWNNSAVDVVFAGTDAVSGIEACSSSVTVATEGAGIVVSGYCLDYAGWSSTSSVALNIDRTAPAIQLSSPAAGGVFAAGRDVVALNFTVYDNLTSTPAVSAVLAQTLDKGSPRGVGASSVAVAAGQALDPMALDDGLWRLEVTAADAAGNSSRAVGGVFEVLHDTIAPVTALVVGEPRFAGEAVFISSATPLLFSTTDDMLVEGDRQGVGAEFTYLSIDGGAAGKVSGAFSLAAEGAHTLSYHSVDKAGNAEAVKTASFSVDNSAPETAYSINGPTYQGAAGLYVSTLAVIGFAAVEPPSSGAASGLAAVFVADSTDTYSVYAGTFAAAEGPHSYAYYAADRLGNAEPARTLAFTSDGTPPASAMAFSSAAQLNAAGRLVISSDTYISFTAADAGAGVGAVRYSVDGSAELVYAAGFTLPAGLHEVSWRAVDNLGNAEPAHKAQLQVGASLREVMLALSPAVLNLKSEGNYVEVRLAVSSAGGAGFDAATIKIAAINDAALSTPIYGQAPGADSKKKKEKLYALSFKFDRAALIAALPPDAVSKVTVEGAFDDGSVFTAEDYLRVIAPVRVGKGKGGRVAAKSGAAVDLPAKALKADAEISVVSVAERYMERVARDARAAAGGFKRRGGPFEFGPEGTVFEEPVEISLPYESYDPKKEKLQVAYWNPSSKDWEPLASTLDTAEKVVKAKVGHFSLYQVVVSTIAGAKIVRPAGEQPGVGVQEAGPSTAFVLGEVYVYPNPAKGGAAPTFHIECGIADSVDIKVYTVSGREAHEATLTAMPAVIDQRYAYEYAWRGHIPSGVYLYFIEARKGGQKIKKTGKFAVVR